MRCGAVIPAAGSANRFGELDKTLVELAGKPVLAWTIEAIAQSGEISEIVIAVNAHNEGQVRTLVSEISPGVPCTIVPGGHERRDSVQAAVAALDESCDLVVIHDAARPLVSRALIQSVVAAAKRHGAAIAAVPPVDTIKRIEGDRVAETLDRRSLVQVQTPQAFRRDWLLQSYRMVPPNIAATDESMLLERAGFRVHIVSGDHANLKITVPEDLFLAAAFLAERGEEK